MPYEPKKLTREDFVRPVTGPGQRALPDAVRKEMRDQYLEQQAEFGFKGERNVRRAKHYIAGAVICMPLITWFFTPVGFSVLWLQIPIYAAYGAALAYLRPNATQGAVATIFTGLLVWLVSGRSLEPSFALMMSVVAYGAVGAAVGVTSE